MVSVPSCRRKIMCILYLFVAAHFSLCWVHLPSWINSFFSVFRPSPFLLRLEAHSVKGKPKKPMHPNAQHLMVILV